MWWHYQEWHNNETNVFVCPYTKCGSVHVNNDNLESHIESTHRQLPRVPTEPEIICFEGTDDVMENNQIQRIEDERSEVSESTNDYRIASSNILREDRIKSPTSMSNDDDYPQEQSKLRAALSNSDYSKIETINRIGSTTTNTMKFPKNKDLLITKENFLTKYESRSPICNNENIQIDNSDDGNTILFNHNVSVTTKTINQEHQIDLGNMEKVFRNGFERDTVKSESTDDSRTNCSDDEEYTPKKQRISRSKQEPYKCDINGCGKTYKNKTNFRHHQDSHKLSSNLINSNTTKSQKQKIEKATTISFFV